MVALGLAVVEDEAVEDHVDALGGRFGLVEFDREDAESRALLVVVLIEGLEHGPVLQGIPFGEVGLVAADYGNGLVDEEPVAFQIAGIDAFGKMDRVAVLGFFQSFPKTLQGFFLGAFLAVLAGGKGNVDVAGHKGTGNGKQSQKHKDFFHGVLLVD